jgi:uncharacterized membrane protein YraQ (UPF0718 family)
VSGLASAAGGLRAPRLRDADRILLVLASGVAASLLVARLGGVGQSAAAQNFVVVFTAIVVEALPFVLLGALVSALLEVVVPERAFARVARLPVKLQVPGVVAGALAFPVCECGSVPVARRLILKGVHPAAGIAFMLAAPIVNPVVVVSTAVAYQGNHQAQMVAGRLVLGLTLAVVVGWVIGQGGAGQLLEQREASHEHAHAGGRARRVVDHLVGDVLFMGRFLVAGAALAAALQTAVPQSAFSGLLGAAPVSALAMMGLAFLLSLCSEADAFVAISFGHFPLSSQLAFLVFGPVMDLKLALLYAGTFGKAFLLDVVLASAAVTVVGAMLFDLLVA